MDLPVIPMTANTLVSYLSGLSAPMQKILELEKKGKIIRLKRGLYISSKGKRCLFLTANHIYGPSYVSLESALRYYGLIPEHVESVTSVTVERTKVFENALAVFSYKHLPADYYRQDIRIVLQENGNFLMASPEKALADLIVLTPGLRLRYVRETVEYLESDLRIDMDALMKMDASVFIRLASLSPKRQALLNIAKIIRHDCI